MAVAEEVAAAAAVVDVVKDCNGDDNNTTITDRETEALLLSFFIFSCFKAGRAGAPYRWDKGSFVNDTEKQRRKIFF